MKNLKIKLGLFSLLAILATSVFLTSCEQEVVQNETQLEADENSITYFTLPESINKMSDEELADFFAEKTEDEILEIAEILPNDRLEERWCTTLFTWSDCVRRVECDHENGHRKKINKKYYCEGQGIIYHTYWGNCCVPY